MKSCEPENRACGLSLSTLPNRRETAYISGMKYGQAHAAMPATPTSRAGGCTLKARAKRAPRFSATATACCIAARFGG